MQNNDISNRTTPYIAFEIDSLLFMESEEKSPLKWAADLLFRSKRKQYLSRKYNDAFVAFLRQLYKETDYNIVLLTNELEEYELEELADKLDHDFVPFSNISSYENANTIRAFCTSEVFMYFFTANDQLLSVVSANNALHFDRVREVLG